MPAPGAVWNGLPVAQRSAIVVLAIAVGVAQVDQPFPYLAPLQHLPTVLAIGCAPWLLRRWPLSTMAMFCIVGFFLLHTLGGRYCYSYVPYDAWSRAVSGRSISETFGLQRNHYDRLVHLSFGVLSIVPVSEILVRHVGVRRGLAILLAVQFVLAISALYEIFEWALTIVAGGAAADTYNGQQGDAWDSQKDMAFAAVGACIAGCALRTSGRDCR